MYIINPLGFIVLALGSTFIKAYTTIVKEIIIFFIIF